MVDVAITPGSVVPGANASVESGTAGEAITAGKVVYRDPNTKKFMIADNNGTADAKKPRGIALNGASLNQPVDVQTAGPLTLGGGLTAGTTYFLSDTAGGICPDVDVVAGETVALLGIAASASVLNIDIQLPGVTR
jgi:hypothetical protein